MSMPLASPAAEIGAQIRTWRRRRRLSQLECALGASISQRHLSFIESGRSRPSRDMVLRIAAHLDVPARELNGLVVAAGYAPVYPERSLQDPALAPARAAVETILRCHEPYPALAIDRHWRLVAANAAVSRLLTLVTDEGLLAPPVNVLRLSLSPGGLAPRIRNLAQWKAHVVDRLARQADMTGDPGLRRLRDEMAAYPAPAPATGAAATPDLAGIVVPLELDTPAGLLSLVSTTTVFGTPVDVTLSELALETFFPADTETARRLAEFAAIAPNSELGAAGAAPSPGHRL